MKFEGIMPALITPLNSDETVNTGVLKALIEHLLENGADGFAVGNAAFPMKRYSPVEKTTILSDIKKAGLEI